MFRTLIIIFVCSLAAYAQPVSESNWDEGYGSANAGTASDDHGASSVAKGVGRDEMSQAAAAVGDEDRPDAPLSPDDVQKPNPVRVIDEEVYSPDAPIEAGSPDLPMSPYSPDSPFIPEVQDIVIPDIPIQPIFVIPEPTINYQDDEGVQKKKKHGHHGKHCKPKFGRSHKKPRLSNDDESSNILKRHRRDTQESFPAKRGIHRIVKKVRDFVDSKRPMENNLEKPRTISSSTVAGAKGSTVSGASVGDGNATGSADRKTGLNVSAVSDDGTSGASAAINGGIVSVDAGSETAAMAAESDKKTGAAGGSVSTGNVESITSVKDGQVSSSVISKDSVGSASGTGAAVSNVVSGPEGAGVAGGTTGFGTSQGQGSSTLDSGIATGSVSLEGNPRSATGASGSAVDGSTSTSLSASGNNAHDRPVSLITAISNRILNLKSHHS